jgi:hypothetical protein
LTDSPGPEGPYAAPVCVDCLLGEHPGLGDGLLGGFGETRGAHVASPEVVEREGFQFALEVVRSTRAVWHLGLKATRPQATQRFAHRFAMCG